MTPNTTAHQYHSRYSLLSKLKTHTCSENSATSIKSLWNWAEVVQGLDGGERGTESSSGRPSCWSSSPSPNPSVPVKASRSGDPIIFRPWAVNPWRIYSSGLNLGMKHMSRCDPAFTRWVSCSHGTPQQQQPIVKYLLYAVVFNHKAKAVLNYSFKEYPLRFTTVTKTSGVFRNRHQRKLNREAKLSCGRQSQG